MAAQLKTNEVLAIVDGVAFVEVATKFHPYAVARVDEDDLSEMVDGNGRWYAVQNCRAVYAARRDRSGPDKPRLLLHRVLLGVPADHLVDHKDRDGLNNRRNNLREATDAQNARNKIGQPRTSAYLGVSWHKGVGRWVAQVARAGKKRHLGYFDEEVAAAHAYDAAVRGDPYSNPNFAEAA